MARERPETLDASMENHQLLVDISIFHKNDAGTGIQRVVRAISEQLSDLDIAGYDVRFVIATKWKKYHYADFINFKNLDTRPKKIKVGSGDVFLGLDLSSRILPRHIRQIKSWKRLGVKISIVVYDLLPISNPEWFNEKQVKPFKKWLVTVANFADQVLCISQTVAKNFEQWLLENGLAREKHPLDVAVIPLGAGIRQSGSSTGIAAREAHHIDNLIDKRFVLLVGTIEPRKGHGVAVAAFDHLFRNNCENMPILIIIGRPGWKTEELQHHIRNHPEAGSRLIWLDDASDELLERLYKACSGVLFPTFAEGFGLPLIEALSYRKPVLARDLPVLRELQSGEVDFFDDDRPEELARRIMDWQAKIERRGNFEYNAPTWKQSCFRMLKLLGINPSH